MSRPQPYVRPMKGWYRRNPRFMRYMLRELTAVFLAAYAVLLMVGVGALGRGLEAWDAYLAFLSSPLSVLLHAIVLVAALYNTITWFAVSPKAMPPVRVAGRPLPDRLVVGSQCIALVVISALMFVVARAL